MSDTLSNSAKPNMDSNGNPTDGRGAWKQFLCRACGWIYDEKLGDPDGGLPAGTRFEDIPEDWECPLCGVTKRDFEPFVSRDEVIAPLIGHHSETGVIVIGGGTAGWTAIEALRKLNENLPITLITSDSGDRYMKPQLSIAISQNKTPETLITKKAVDLAQALNVTLVAQTFVLSIDTNERIVRTTRGNFSYQKLILATGATPMLPPSLPAEYVWRVNHIDMFAKLQAKLIAKPNQHITIIGAGMIGTEIAEDIAKAGHQVTLINRDSLPMAEILPTIGGERLRDALMGIGIDYIGNANITDIRPQDDGYVITYNNQSLYADEIIASTGLILDNRLAKGAGIEYIRCGIVVNPKTLQTSHPAIYAIGDCIAIDDKPCRFVAPLREQAAAIAHHISDMAHAGYQHKSPLIRLKTKSIIVSATGEIEQAKDWQVQENTDDKLILTQSSDGVITAKIEMKTSPQAN